MAGQTRNLLQTNSHQNLNQLKVDESWRSNASKSRNSHQLLSSFDLALTHQKTNNLLQNCCTQIEQCFATHIAHSCQQ